MPFHDEHQQHIDGDDRVVERKDPEAATDVESLQVDLTGAFTLTQQERHDQETADCKKEGHPVRPICRQVWHGIVVSGAGVMPDDGDYAQSAQAVERSEEPAVSKLDVAVLAR